MKSDHEGDKMVITAAEMRQKTQEVMMRDSQVKGLVEDISDALINAGGYPVTSTSVMSVLLHNDDRLRFVVHELEEVGYKIIADAAGGGTHIQIHW